MTNYVIHKRMK